MMAGSIVSSGQVSIGSSVIGETLVDYGLVINTLVGSGGNLQVDGTATGTVVSAGGVEDAGTYGYNGVAIASVVLGGGQSIVVNSAVSATISSGGSQFIDGGVAFNTVLNGGVEVVETQLYVGGPAIIGSSINTVINNGGLEFVNSGAIANATIINSGGTLVSAPGAVVIDAVNNGGQVISTGSVQLLANGGFLVGVTPLSGTVSDDTVSILSGLGASGLSLTGTTETGLCNASDHVISVGPIRARRTIPRSGFV